MLYFSEDLATLANALYLGYDAEEGKEEEQEEEQEEEGLPKVYMTT